jgi:hypothetical protein
MAESIHAGHDLMIGQAATDKLGLYGETPIVQQAAVTTVATSVLGTASLTALTTGHVANLNDAITAINSLIVRIQNFGITA